LVVSFCAFVWCALHNFITTEINNFGQTNNVPVKIIGYWLLNYMEEVHGHLRKQSRLRKQLKKKKVAKSSATLGGQFSRMQKLKNYRGQKSQKISIKLD